MLTPLDTGLDVIVDDKTAGAAFHGYIVREEFDFLTALGALLYRERGGAQIRCPRTVIEHGYSGRNVCVPADEDNGRTTCSLSMAGLLTRLETRVTVISPAGQGLSISLRSA